MFTGMKYTLTKKQFSSAVTGLVDLKVLDYTKYVSYLKLIQEHDDSLRNRIELLEASNAQYRAKIKKLNKKRKSSKAKHPPALYKKSALTLTAFKDIEKRCRDASPGPWEFIGPDTVKSQMFSITLGQNDAKFIANARTDIPKLLFELARIKYKLSILRTKYERSKQ